MNIIPIFRNETLLSHGSGKFYGCSFKFKNKMVIRFSWGGYGCLKKSEGGSFTWLPTFNKQYNIYNFDFLAGGITVFKDFY